MNTTTAAAEAHVTTATIRSWCRNGVVAATKAAGRWIIDAASLAHRIAIGALKSRRRPITLTIENMIAIGGRRWQKNGMDRVYINNWHVFAGIHISRYKSGNVSGAAIAGLGAIANSRADGLLAAIDKLWFDAADGKLHCTHYGAREYEIRLLDGGREWLDLTDRAFDGILAAVAAL